MLKRNWSAVEKANAIDLYKAHSNASHLAGDTSMSHYGPHPWVEAQQNMERYLLNNNQDDLRFNVDRDGTMEVDGIHKWWSVLQKNINEYGTADPVKKRRLIEKEEIMEKKYKAVKDAKSHIDYLNMKADDAEEFLDNFDEKLEKAEQKLEQAQREFNEYLDTITMDLDLSSSV